MKRIIFLLVLLSVCNLFLSGQSLRYKELLYGGQHKELIQLIKNEIPEDKIVGDTLRSLAQAYEGLLKYREAYAYYSRWLSADSTSIDALGATARMALQLGRVQEGENLYLKAYALDTTHFNVGLQLAKLYYQLKNFNRAYDYYYALLLQDTTNVSLLTSVGDCLSEGDFFSKAFAINFYQEAVELNKENVSLAITLINAMLGIRDLAPDIYMNRSMEVCDTALVYNPGNKSLLRSKGVIHFLKRDYYACDSIMTGLIEAGDSTLMNFHYAAMARFTENRYFSAIPYLEYLYMKDDENVDLIMKLGISYGNSYDRKRALSLFDEAERLLQPTAEQLYNLALQRGITYRANQEPSVAANYFWQASGLSKENRKAVLSMLVGLHSFYPPERLIQATPEQYARGLFAYVAYMRTVKEAATEDNKDRNVTSCRNMLSLFLEDMFFKDVDRLQMILPDGKREWITREELQLLSK